ELSRSWSELKLRLPRRPRERDHIPHVLHPRDEHHRTLEPQPEPRVRHGAVTAQVAVPPVFLEREAHLLDPRVKIREALLALAAADDLPDAGDAHVHRRAGVA